MTLRLQGETTFALGSHYPVELAPVLCLTIENRTSYCILFGLTTDLKSVVWPVSLQGHGRVISRLGTDLGCVHAANINQTLRYIAVPKCVVSTLVVPIVSSTTLPSIIVSWLAWTCRPAVKGNRADRSWRAKQPSHAGCVLEDLKPGWGAWDTTCGHWQSQGHHTESITWRSRGRVELKSQEAGSTIFFGRGRERAMRRQSDQHLELFQGPQHWGNSWETGWSAYGPCLAHRYHLAELNWTELWLIYTVKLTNRAWPTGVRRLGYPTCPYRVGQTREEDKCMARLRWDIKQSVYLIYIPAHERQ